MRVCALCERKIVRGILYGYWDSANKDARPICINCLKRLMESDGKYFGLKERIEKWLTEGNYSFTILHEPIQHFHFMIKDVGSLKMIIEIFQEEPDSNLIIGFVTFLSKDLLFKLAKFERSEIDNFKRKVDEFLPTLRVDYRIGYKVEYRIIEEKGNYGGQFHVRLSPENCTKETFFTIIQLVQDVGEKVDSFLSEEIKNRT